MLETKNHSKSTTADHNDLDTRTDEKAFSSFPSLIRDYGKLPHLLEILHEPVLILDEELAIAYANRAFSKLSGFEPQDVLGKPLGLLCNTKDFQTIHRRMQDYLHTGKNLTIQSDFRRKNGPKIHVSMSCTPIPREGVSYNGIFILITDITERIRLNNIFLNGKREWERTVDVVQDYLIVADENNVIKRVNISLAKELNLHPRDIVGNHCNTFFDFCLPHLSNIPIKRIFENKNKISRDIYSNVLNTHLYVSLHPITDNEWGNKYLIYIVKNINKEKTTENSFLIAKRELENIIEDKTKDLVQANKDLMQHIQEKNAIQRDKFKLASIIEQSDVGIILTDKQWGIQYTNHAFTQITGINRERTASDGRQSLLGYLGEPFSERKKMDSLLRTKGALNGRLTKCRDNGSRYEIDVRILPLKDQEGVITNYYAILRDITQEVLLEKRIRNAEKMEVIGIFAAGIAHDFNNILGGILGSIELAMDEIDTESIAYKDLLEAIQYAENAKKIIKEILTFRHHDSVPIYPIDLKETLQEVLFMVQKIMPKDIRLVQEYTSGNWMILGNSNQIQQVMMNLCTNAAHAMNNKGDIHIKYIEEKISSSVHTNQKPLQAGDYVHISVKDSGYGIQKDILERIFEPFFTTKKASGGTGIGLAIVTTIINRLGGCVLVDSVPEKGTTFHIYIPRYVP